MNISMNYHRIHMSNNNFSKIHAAIKIWNLINANLLTDSLGRIEYKRCRVPIHIQPKGKVAKS